MKVPSLRGLLIALLPGSFTVAAVSSVSSVGTPSKPAWVKDADQLIDFPKPNPETAFADLKLLRADGSAFRTPKEDWAGARVRMKTDTSWAKWVTDKRTEIDTWMRGTKDRVGWEAGWNHEFVSPTDGGFLVWTPEVPGEDVPFLKSRSGERVAVTPKIARAWVGAFRKKNAEQMGEAARLFRLTGDARYADWVAGQLDFYADNYRSWGSGVAQRKNSWLGYQSLDDAVIVSRFVEAARLIFDRIEPARRSRWYDELFKPEADLLDRTYQVIHNIGLWQRSTQAQVALLYRDEAMWSRVVDGEYGVRAQIRRGVTGDYLWYEQSMNYNGFVVVAVEPLLTFAGLLGEGDRLAREAAIVQNLMLAPIYLRFSDGTLPNPADATGLSRVSTGMLAQTYRILPTTLGLARAASTRSWDALIDPPGAIAEVSADAEALPPVVSRSFESTRFALLKQGAWQVFFHYGQVNQSHSQAEALNWSASFEGVDVTHDSGTVGYGSPMASGYYRQGLNHNVPLFGGEGQKSWNQGVLLRFDADAAIMSAAQPEYRPGVSASRTLRIEGDALVDEVTLSPASDAEPNKTRGLALHLQGKPRLPVEFQPLSSADFSKGRPPAFGYWKSVRAARFTDRAEVAVELAGGRVLTVTFSTPGAFTLFQGDSPDVPPAHRVGFYLEKSAGTGPLTIITTLRPKSGDE
jgi:oligo-alginate lyase